MLEHFSDERQSDGENPPPSLRVAVKIRPYLVVGLGWGPATACGLRLV